MKMMNFSDIEQKISQAKQAAKNHSKPMRANWSANLIIPQTRRPLPFKRIIRNFFSLMRSAVFGTPFVGNLLRNLNKVRHLKAMELKVRDLNEDVMRQIALARELKDKIDHITHHLDILRGDVSELRSSARNIPVAVLSAEGNAAKSVTQPTAKVDLGRLYVAFEQRFRASSEEIVFGYKDYGDIVDQLPKQIKSLPSYDLGCGRGEWLGYLKKRDIKCVGVDSNKAMVEACIASGQEAVHGDLINYVTKLPTASAAVISAFHVVEHLPFPVLLQLIDESFRVLARGGIAIFETPNPENILVGACTFYTDPTHLNPIPPHSLDFLVLQRGFDHTKVLRKNPRPLGVESADPAVRFVLDWFAKEQDYAIVAFKS